VKFIARFDGTHFIPSSADSVEAWEKLHRGAEYTVEVKQARNPRFHRLAFALIKAMYESQERFTNMEAFRTELKLQCGSYDHYVRHTGEIVYMPHSWSFADMDDIEFHEIYEKLLDIASARFGAGFVAGFEEAA